MHNANSLAIALEMLVAGTRLNPALVAIAPLYGLAYVMFAWIQAHFVSPKHGVQVRKEAKTRRQTR